MSGAKFMKKTALSILMTVFAACTGSAIALGVVPEKTYKASAESIQVEVGVSEADYSVATASVRLPDETYDSGALRYHVKMSVEKYNSIFNADGSVKEANTKTGALILPAYLMGEATELTPSTPSVMDVNTTSAWDPVYKADGSVDYYEVKVCLTGIPQPNHSSKLVVRSYVKDASGNYAYTTQKDSTSISDVALSVYNNANTSDADKNVLKTTYLDKLITYNRNGETVTKTAMYGSTMSALEAENNEFIAWYDANGVEYDFNSTITSGNVTLYGVYEQNIVATAESPAVNMSAYTAGGKYTVANVTMNGANVSSSENPAVLEIPASMGLGDKDLTVTLKKADGSMIEIPVSATLLTGVISTAADWLAILPKTGDTGITNGQQHYYKLTNDLDLVYGEYYNDPDYINGDDTQKAAIKQKWKQNIEAGFLQRDGAAWWPSSDKAFMGIIDGNGYTVQCSSRWAPHGQFCTLDGAVIKDVTFNNIYYYSINHAPMFARYIFNTTMEDVVINITGYAQSGYLDSIDKVNVEYNGSKLHALGMIAVCGFSKNTLKRVNIYADNVWKSATEPSAGLTIASIFGSDYEKLGANTFEDCVISADEVRNVGYVTNIDAANQTYEYTSLVAEEAGLTIIKSGEHTHAYEKWVVSSNMDTLVCSGCSRPNGTTFDKTVDATSQEIVLKGAGTQSISLAGISAYNSVSSIKYGDYNLGNDINSLVIPSELQQDTQNHGYQTITVVVDDTVTEAGTHEIKVPVLFVTEQFSDFVTLTNTVRYNADSAIYGYYTLGTDIVDTTFATNAASAYQQSMGFRGTFDGRSHSITANFDLFANGIFGTTGDGAVIKDLTVTTTSYSKSYRSLLSHTSYGTQLLNVTFNVEGGTGTSGNLAGMGLITTGSWSGNAPAKWKNVVINSNVPIAALCAGYINETTMVYEDCVFNAPSYTVLAHLSTNKMFTTLDGITVNSHIHQYTGVTSSDMHYDYMKCQGSDTCGALTFKKSVTAATRYMYLEDATTSLTLDGVSKFTSVSSASIGGTDYAVTASFSDGKITLTFPETYKADAQKHGEQTLSVVVVDEYGFEHTVLVPVIMVTKKIATRQDLMSLTYAPSAWTVNKAYTQGSGETYTVSAKEVVYGYYVLTQTKLMTTSVAANNWTNIGAYVATYPTSNISQYGFRGTIDGMGKELYLSNMDDGLFGIIGEGAIFKNMTFTDGWYTGYDSASLLAQYIYGATFDNVTFKIADVSPKTDNKKTGANYGWLCRSGCANLKFTNCKVEAPDYHVGSLLGKIDDLSTIKIDNATIAAINVASLVEIGYTKNGDVLTPITKEALSGS